MHDNDMINLTEVRPGLSPDTIEKHLEGVQVLIFNRLFGPEDTCVETIKKAQSLGIKVICDIDDFWMLHKGHLLEHIYAVNNTTSKIEECMRVSDMVWVTHELLASDARKINPNVCIIPNAINPNEKQWAQAMKPLNIFGWIGSRAHGVDLELLRKPMQKYWADRSLTWGVSLGGFDAGDIATSTRFQDILTAGHKAPKERYRSNMARPIEEYAMLYDMVGVGLIPLADNEFNRRKSELKMLEFAAKGRTCIVSNIHPYSNIATNKNSYLCDEPMDFYRAMRKVEKKPHQAVQKAMQLRHDVADLYNWDKICYLRLEQLRKVWHS
jgi:hypothetical protein